LGRLKEWFTNRRKLEVVYRAYSRWCKKYHCGLEKTAYLKGRVFTFNKVSYINYKLTLLTTVKWKKGTIQSFPCFAQFKMIFFAVEGSATIPRSYPVIKSVKRNQI
jgi:hypothetical protein